MNGLRIFVTPVSVLAFLVIPSTLLSYDTSPSSICIVPECIWAPATGEGTWVTELQITALMPGTIINAAFCSNGGNGSVYNLWTSSGTNTSIRFSNILSILQARDPSFTYYGKVGTLMLFDLNSAHRFHAQARIMNGNYGKTLPGLPYDADGNSANVGRNMMIQDITQNTTCRTFVGCFNSSSSGMTVQFAILNPSGRTVGNVFTKTFSSVQFMSFNPFAEAGLGSATYEYCRLYITSTASSVSGPGLFCFGSSVNNYTNDSAALMAVQDQ